MKVKDYVDKYAPMVAQGKDGAVKALEQLHADLVREGNSTLRLQRALNASEAGRIVHSLNDRANLITEQIARVVGRKWATPDWFTRFTTVEKPTEKRKDGA